MIICHNLTVSAFVIVQLSVKSGYGSLFAVLLCAVLCNSISELEYIYIRKYFLTSSVGVIMDTVCLALYIYIGLYHANRKMYLVFLAFIYLTSYFLFFYFTMSIKQKCI